MKMTFEQYINNPMGIKNAVFSAREMYRNLYIEKLKVLMVRETGRVKYNLYINKKEDKYYVHMKIPSEVIPNFYYDTVIEFYNDNKLFKKSNLKDYYVRFYSNDPSFVFTFAHAMLKNKMFIKELVPRMSKQAVKQVAKEKNPKNEIGYVKSIYFTYLLMKDYGLFNKDIFENQASIFNLKTLLSNITQAEDKVQARIDAQKELNKSKKIHKKKENNSINKREEQPNTVNNTRSIGKVNTIRNIKTVNRMNTVKNIKRK